MNSQPPATATGPLAGKRALVAGAAGGVGLLAARALAQTGAGLCLNGRNVDALDKAAHDLRQEFSIDVDVEGGNPANPVDAEAIAMAAGDAHIFINCTGNLPAGTLDTISAERWRNSWEAAVFAPINLTREMVSHMRDTPGALIVLVIDAALEPNPRDTCATTAGGALMALVEAMGRAAKDDHDMARVVGLITARDADQAMDAEKAADIAAAISMMACAPERWKPGALLTPAVVLASAEDRTT